MPKTGCIIRPEIKAQHAAMSASANLLLPAYSRGVNVVRYGGNNATVGTCAVVAAIMAAATKAWRDSGAIITPPHDLDIQIYSIVTGYDASKTDANGFNPTDQGTDPEVLFAWWKLNPILGYKLRGFTRINPANLNAQKNSIVALGLYLCSQLSDAQVGAQTWHAGTPNPAEGHATWMDGYIASRIDGTSWGLSLEADDAMIAAQAAAAYSLDLIAA
jgi:hypothetical protein